MNMRWTRKDLLGIRELSADEINFVLETADAFKQVGTREIKKVPALRGKTLVNFFVEPSTRTHTSFEIAASRLSADVLNISASTSSLTKGETLKDTAKVLEANHADIIVLRHGSAGAPQFTGRLHDSRKERCHREFACCDHRRHSLQSRRTLEYFRPNETGGARDPGWAEHTCPA